MLTEYICVLWFFRLYFQIWFSLSPLQITLVCWALCEMIKWSWPSYMYVGCALRVYIYRVEKYIRVEKYTKRVGWFECIYKHDRVVCWRGAQRQQLRLLLEDLVEVSNLFTINKISFISNYTIFNSLIS